MLGRWYQILASWVITGWYLCLSYNLIKNGDVYGCWRLEKFGIISRLNLRLQDLPRLNSEIDEGNERETSDLHGNVLNPSYFVFNK